MSYYHAVMTLSAHLVTGPKTVMWTDVIKVEEGQTREDVFWRLFNDMCRKEDLPATAVVLFWSLEPDDLPVGEAPSV